MSTVAQGTDDYILVVIWITVWNQESFDGFLLPLHSLVILDVYGYGGGFYLSVGVEKPGRMGDSSGQ